MTTGPTVVTKATLAMLSEFHKISDNELQAVQLYYADGSLVQLILNFGSIYLIVMANENDDSIEFVTTDTNDFRNSGGADASHREPWKRFIGKSFGWGWVTVNQQGYCDGLLLSFESIIPQVMLNVMASSIKIALINVVANETDRMD
jgi:hypothetical protein